MAVTRTPDTKGLEVQSEGENMSRGRGWRESPCTNYNRQVELSPKGEKESPCTNYNRQVGIGVGGEGISMQQL